MTGGKQYISWATKFDTYKGRKNWQNLSLDERATIARYELDGLPEELDIHEFVMGTDLRRIQFDGLRTVIVRVALALENELGVRFGSDSAKYSLILPYLESTSLGQELRSLVDGTAGEHTYYRMGELEFLAQSGSRASPLDRLLDLPTDLRLQGILQLLKPKNAIDPSRLNADDREASAADLDKMPFLKAMRLLEAGQVELHASYTGSLQAVSRGAVNVGPAGRLAGIGFWAAPIIGLIAAVLVSGWWLPLGLVVGVSAFRYSRKAAVNAVLRKACADETFFEFMRSRQLIWLNVR